MSRNWFLFMGLLGLTACTSNLAVIEVDMIIRDGGVAQMTALRDILTSVNLVCEIDGSDDPVLSCTSDGTESEIKTANAAVEDGYIDVRFPYEASAGVFGAGEPKFDNDFLFSFESVLSKMIPLGAERVRLHGFDQKSREYISASSFTVDYLN